MEQTSNSGPGEPPATLIEALVTLEQSLAAGRAELAALRAQYQALLRRLRSERARASDLAWELSELELRLRDLQEQREGPADPLVERELASMAVQRAALEELALTQLFQIDELEARHAAVGQALDAGEREWAAREATLIAERERIAGLLDDQQGESEERGWE